MYLPTELLLQVLQYLDKTEFMSPTYLEEHELRQKTLASLCLVSRTLHELAQPMLYKTFIKHNLSTRNADQWLTVSPSHPRQIRSSLSRKNTRLEMFMRTLLLRSDLANKVEFLRIEDDTEDPPSRVNDARRSVKNGSLDIHLGRLFANAPRTLPKLHNMMNFDRREWCKDLMAGKEEAEIALLPVLMPNITSFDLESHQARPGMLFGHYLKSLHGNGVLSKVRFLRIRSCMDTACPTSTELGMCRSLLRLPSLEAFSGYGLSEIYSVGPFGFAIDEPLTPLRHLGLDLCLFRPDTFGALLKGCPQLESLIVAFDKSDLYGVVPVLDRRFFASLHTKHNTLDRLVLLMPRGYGIEHPSRFTTPFNLRPLKKLQYLEIDMYTCFPMYTDQADPDILEQFPKSLRSLVLRHCSHLLPPFLEVVLRGSKKSLPLLRTIEVRIDYPELKFREFLIECFEDYYKLAENSGIQFSVTDEAIGRHGLGRQKILYTLA